MRCPSGTESAVKKISGDAKAWAEGLSSIFVELEFAQSDPTERLQGVMYTYPFGDSLFVRAVTRGGNHTVTRSRRLIQASQRNNFYVGCILAGNSTLTQGEHCATLDRGDLAILDSTKEYSIHVERGFDALWVEVPRHRLEGRLPAFQEIMAERIDGSMGLGNLASTMLRTALKEASNVSPTDANRITNAVLDLLGLSLASHLKAETRNTPHCKTTLRRIQTYIEEHLDDEQLSLETVATAHAVSVRYINKLFEREGVSTARWIRMRRLERCRADLEDPAKRDLSICQIGYANGFGNISSFNRAFKQRFGTSPKTLRGL